LGAVEGSIHIETRFEQNMELKFIHFMLVLYQSFYQG